MINVNLSANTDKELKQYIKKILEHKVSTDYLHDETPTHKIFALYQLQDNTNKRKIKKSLYKILKESFADKLHLKLNKKLEDLLGDLAFLAESLKINESYILLRSLLDKGTLSPGKKYFLNKDTEKKILRSLIILQPQKLLYETIWKLYWEADDPFFWDISFIGIRRSNIELAIGLLPDALKRWRKSKLELDFPQALFDLTNQIKDEGRLQQVKNALGFLNKSESNLIRNTLNRKGLDKNIIDKILPQRVLSELNDKPIDNKNKFYIYYHSDMDGIGSCVLLIYYLRRKYDFKMKNLMTIPVDYDLKDQWSKFEIKKPAAILDFLYHKDAEIWFEHHKDPFVTKEFYNHYKSRFKNNGNNIIWEETSTSVISMLFSRWQDFYKNQYPEIYQKIKKMVSQIDKIDSGRYDGVEEWYDCNFESCKINLVLTQNRINNYDYCNKLVLDLFKYGCVEIIKRPNFDKLYRKAKRDMEKEYNETKDILKNYDKIIFYNSTKTKKGIFFRFFPYKYYPNAIYTVGLYRKRNSYEVSIGENPWLKHPLEIDIGSLCRAFGGGGHPTVGGITKNSYKEAYQISQRIINTLRKPIS